MADRITLPARKGTISYSDEHIADIAESLDDLPVGEAVIVDEAQDTETKARDRAQKVKDLLVRWSRTTMKVKAHSVPGEDENGDAGFIPAVSLPVGR
jgi:hypothetical protein